MYMKVANLPARCAQFPRFLKNDKNLLDARL